MLTRKLRGACRPREGGFMKFKPISFWITFLLIVEFSPGAFSNSKNSIVVDTTEELIAAMVPENAGRTILIKSGIYHPNQPLTVPPMARVEGEGMMEFDSEGLPSGFAPGTETEIDPVSDPSYPGQWILKLSDGASIRGLKITNNVILTNTIRIKAQGEETTRASVLECEIHGPGGPEFYPPDFPPGPTAVPVGRPLYIHTGILPVPLTNPDGDPVVDVSISRSFVDAHGGSQTLF